MTSDVIYYTGCYYIIFITVSIDACTCAINTIDTDAIITIDIGAIITIDIGAIITIYIGGITTIDIGAIITIYIGAIIIIIPIVDETYGDSLQFRGWPNGGVSGSAHWHEAVAR